VIYAGTDDGNLQVTRDGGATWTNVADRIRGLPERTYATGVFASAHVEGRVYASFDGHRNDDYVAYVYVSEDYGQSWRQITEGLPVTSVNRVIEHPRTADLLFVANEVGVFFSLDRGQSWSQLKNNLPTVPVDVLLIHPRENDLVVGTHGRSIWILDDITPLEELSQAMQADRVHLFPVKTARMLILTSPESFNAGYFSAPNPTRGARIRYLLAYNGQPDHIFGEMHPPGEDAHTPDPDHFTVRITILDGDGNVVRTVSEPGSGTKGLHEWAWDLRMELPFEIEVPEGAGFRGGPRGPLVMPGDYTVQIEAGGDTATTTVTVEPDPRISVPMADLRVRRDALMSLFPLLEPAYNASQTMREIQEEVERIESLLDAREGVTDEDREHLSGLQQVIDRAAREANQAFSQVASIMSGIEGCFCRPTEDELYRAERAWPDVRDAVEAVNQVVREVMPGLYREMGERGHWSTEFDAVVMPRRGG
ncbi:hypothetical protein ACGF5M_02330, partial [Gemmatimonadota bacterium]